jgi:hypothetical protein
VVCIDRDDAQVSATVHFLYLRYKISLGLGRNAVRLDFGFQISFQIGILCSRQEATEANDKGQVTRNSPWKV